MSRWNFNWDKISEQNLSCLALLVGLSNANHYMPHNFHQSLLNYHYCFFFLKHVMLKSRRVVCSQEFNSNGDVLTETRTVTLISKRHKHHPNRLMGLHRTHCQLSTLDGKCLEPTKDTLKSISFCSDGTRLCVWFTTVHSIPTLVYNSSSIIACLIN